MLLLLLDSVPYLCVGGWGSFWMKKIKVWTFLSSICPSLNMQSRKWIFSWFFLSFLRSSVFAWLNIKTLVKVSLCVQVWRWAVWVWRWACFHRLSLESVHRGSPRRLQPSLPILICSTSRSTLNQVRKIRFSSNLSIHLLYLLYSHLGRRGLGAVKGREAGPPWIGHQWITGLTQTDNHSHLWLI